MDLRRLYEYRFRDVEQDRRAAVWQAIAPHVWEQMGRPARLLDPAAGRGEFVNAAPAAERWAVDLVEHAAGTFADGVRVVVADVFEADLPQAHFDGVFVSNFLEHLASPEEVARLLERLAAATAPGGRIAIMGPNYRYTEKVYWDYADHVLALTHRAIEEHLYTAGFEPERTIPRYLPYSFNGRLPASPALVRRYLRTPPAWRVLGKQFLVIARR
ncbi:MAG TPA: class I SAM-dependent methyltransferase [Solirubrobacteraceae bacterium]|jgi:SAM-dependent methyltransferase